MMPGTIAIILLAFDMCTYAKELTVEHTANAQDSEDGKADELIDMLLDRTKPLTLKDLDDTTAAKTAALAQGSNLNLVPRTQPVTQAFMNSRTGNLAPLPQSQMQSSPGRVLGMSSSKSSKMPKGRGQVQVNSLFGGGGDKIGPGDPVVAVVGYTGGVGSALTKAMKAIGLKPFALVSGSKGMSIDGKAAVDVDWPSLNKQLLEAAKEKGGIPVVADVTASGAVQELYETWLKEGITVVAANKGIFAGPEGKYEALLKAAAAEPKARLLHETTVGAGLPVLSTIKGLVESSNKVEKIEGVLSGTLAYVLGEVAGGKTKFSDAVKKAKELGYTEPDPRDDLNGMDVARKSVILARVSGLKGVELAKMNIESLVPESLRECSVEEFMAGLPAFDDDFAKRVAETEAKGERLHYAGAVDMKKKQVIVGPLGFAGGHPFNNAGPDNLVSISTNFYTRPLVVQGAGAGGDVTATGVLADIMIAKNQPL